MRHPRFPQLLALLIFTFPLVTGCGDDDDDGESGGDTDGGDPPAEDPDPQGQVCDEPGTMGWKSTCTFSVVNAWYDDTVLFHEEDVELETLFPGEQTCCGGCAPPEEADDACTARCLAKLCGTVRALHEDNKAWTCALPWVDCTFPMSDCLQGLLEPVTVISTGSGSIAEFNILCADADASHEPGSDGCYAEAELEGVETCMTASSYGESEGFVATDDLATADAGTSATLQWQLGSDPELARSNEVDATATYGLDPCADGVGECLHLTWLGMELPSLGLGGITVESAHLGLVTVHAAPRVGSAGEFELPAGSLEVLLSARTAAGRFDLVRTNAAPVSGRVSPATNTLLLAGLDFDYSDSVVSASLSIDLQARYDRRAPAAVIAVSDAPLDCTDPVAFRAASVDHDGDPMTHRWVTGDGIRGIGELFEAVLAPGEHTVRLTSVDSHGGFDTDALTYHRRCQ